MLCMHYIFARHTVFNWCLVGDEQWGRQSISLQGEQEDGEPPQMVQLTHSHLFNCGVHLWDGFLLLLTLGRDGEPEALRWWGELILWKFEPSWSSIFKTHKLISIMSGWIWFSVVAFMMLIAVVRHPSSPVCLEISYAGSLALLHYILNMWLVHPGNQLMSREASYPSDHTRNRSAVMSTPFKHLFLT